MKFKKLYEELVSNVKSKIILPKMWVDYLSDQPESGMGYQIVDIKFDDGTSLNGVVVSNGEYVEMNPIDAKKNITEITVRV